MMLTDATANEFQFGDRTRGTLIDHRSMVNFLEVGDRGARAMVQGSSGGSFMVALDFQDIGDGDLGASCDCPRFQDGYPCKHLWATLKKFELTYDRLAANKSTLELFHIDPDDVTIGAPLTIATAHHPGTPGNRSKRKTGKQNARASKAASVPAWKSQLSQITKAVQLPRSSHSIGLPTDVLPDSVHRAQHWFVLSVSEPANRDQMQVVAMRSTRKNNGDWSRPAASELTSSEIEQIVHPDERHAFSLLRPCEEYSSHRHYGYYRRGNRMFSVEQPLLRDTLTALYKTGRLAWTLGNSRQHFEDARQIDDVSVDCPATVRLKLTSNPGKKSELLSRRKSWCLSRTNESATGSSN